MAAATSAGVMRAHFGARYTWPRRCCAGCRTAAADHLLLETMGCAAVGRSFVMSSNSTEAWDAQEWVVTELQHHPCRLFHPYPVPKTSWRCAARRARKGGRRSRAARRWARTRLRAGAHTSGAVGGVFGVERSARAPSHRQVALARRGMRTSALCSTTRHCSTSSSVLRPRWCCSCSSQKHCARG